MDIDNLMADDGSVDYYDRDFRNTLEAHMSYLKGLDTTYSVSVTEHQGVVYRGDLYGLLNELNIPLYCHWVIMRLNDFKSANEFNENYISILIPSESELESIRQSWKASQVIDS
jgi:hypothetical protein